MAEECCVLSLGPVIRGGLHVKRLLGDDLPTALAALNRLQPGSIQHNMEHEIYKTDITLDVSLDQRYCKYGRVAVRAQGTHADLDICRM